MKVAEFEDSCLFKTFTGHTQNNSCCHRICYIHLTSVEDGLWSTSGQKQKKLT